jgi:hypothetical protein
MIGVAQTGYSNPVLLARGSFVNRLRFLFILPMLLLGAVSALADGTLPATPAAADCTVSPLAPDDLTAIVQAGFIAAPDLDETDMPVDPDDIAAVTGVLLQSLACTNANSPLQALALDSDRYLAEHFAGDAGSDELGHLLAAATRAPAPAATEDRIALTAVTNAVLYADGRLGVDVATTNADGTWIDRIVFIEVQGAWKIDQVLPGDEIVPAARPIASPATGDTTRIWA